jgi:hypothetical protein
LLALCAGMGHINEYLKPELHISKRNIPLRFRDVLTESLGILHYLCNALVLIPNASFSEIYTCLLLRPSPYYLYAVLNGPPLLLLTLKCLVCRWFRVQLLAHFVPVSGL